MIFRVKDLIFRFGCSQTLNSKYWRWPWNCWKSHKPTIFHPMTQPCSWHTFGGKERRVKAMTLSFSLYGGSMDENFGKNCWNFVFQWGTIQKQEEILKKKTTKIIEKLPKYWQIRINQWNYEKMARFCILSPIFSRKFWQKIVEFFNEISS